MENFHLLSDSTGQVFALRDLGRTFLMLGHQDSAIICNQKAIALMRKRIIPSVYTELAGFYIDRQRLEEAHGLLRTSLQNVAKPQAKYPVYLVLGERLGLLLLTSLHKFCTFTRDTCRRTFPFERNSLGERAMGTSGVII